MAIPVGVAALRAFLGGDSRALLGLVFPLVGVGLLAWAVRKAADWRRFGRVSFTMDPHPGAIGGQVGGTLELPVPFDRNHRFKTTLTCVYSYVSGAGKNRSRDERVVWQTQGFAHARPHGGGTRLEILFDVDEGLPASDPSDRREYHIWRLNIEAGLPGADFDRSFEIPVFPTGERAKRLRSLCKEHPAASEQRARAIEDVLDLRRISGGVEVHYPAFRHPMPKLGAAALGVVFLGVGLSAESAPFILRLLFDVIGAGAAAGSIYHLLVSLRVRIDGTHVELRKSLLGLPVGSDRVPRYEIEGLSLRQGLSITSREKKHTVYFKLQARTRDGRELTIGHNLLGRETASEVLHSLSALTGIPASARE